VTTARGWTLRVEEFVADVVAPVEARYGAELAETQGRGTPAVVSELRVEARRRGLWNLCLTDEVDGQALSSMEYAPLAEITRRSPPAAEAINCAGPDSVDMEILLPGGLALQQQECLRPLAEGEVHSCSAMAKPEMASCDARNSVAKIRR